MPSEKDGSMTQRTKQSLTPAKKRLLALMQELNFGRIEQLTFINGDPVFDPPPRVVRQIKFGGENGPRREKAMSDFNLKSEMIELFDELIRLGSGTVECLEIKHGLPFRMNLEVTVQA